MRSGPARFTSRQPTADSARIDNYAPTYYWSAIEAGTGIVGACLPTMGPLFKDRRTNKSRGRPAADDGGFPSNSHRQSLLRRNQGSRLPGDRELDEISKARSDRAFDSVEGLEDGLRDVNLPATPTKATFYQRGKVDPLT